MKDKSQKKKKAQSKKRSGPGPARPKTTTPAVQVPRAPFTAAQVCAITDPFCPAARGAKWPDGSQVPSLAYTYRYRFSIPVGTGGTGAVVVIPGYTYNLAFNTSMTGTTAGFTTVAGLSPTIAANTYRIVSWGARCKSTASPMNNSGMLRVRAFNNITGAGLVAVDFASLNCANSMDIPMRDVNDVCIVGTRISKQSAFYVTPLTTNPDGNVTNWVSPGFGPVVIGIEGATASSSPLDVELVFHYELGFADGDSMNLVTTPSKVENQQLLQAQSIASKSLDNFVASGKKGVESIVMRAAESAGRALVMAVAGRFGGPSAAAAAGAMVPYHITVD